MPKELRSHHSMVYMYTGICKNIQKYTNDSYDFHLIQLQNFKPCNSEQ